MRLARLTASGIDLAELCPHPASLDAGSPNRASSAAASGGNTEHDHIDGTIDTADQTREEDEEKREEEIERGHIAASFSGVDIEPKSETHAKWLTHWWDKERHLPWKSERAFAVNPFTSGTLCAPDDAPQRDYDWATRGIAYLEDEHIPGTCDAYVIAGGVLRIVDWKTGRAAHVGHPSRSGQLHLLALAISRHIGWRGPVSLEYVKVNGDRCWVETALVSRADLLAFQGRLCDLLRRIRKDSRPIAGWWCKAMFCNFRGVCEATRGAVAATVPALLAGQPFRVSLTAAGLANDAHAAWQHAAIDAAEQVLQEAKEALRERARRRAIPLGGGRFYGEKEETREKIVADAPGLEAKLREVFGEHGATVVQIRRVATQKAFSAAASAVAKARSEAAGKRVFATKVEAEARMALRSIGALKTSSFKKITEYKVEAAKAPAVPLAEVMREIGEALEEHRQTG